MQPETAGTARVGWGFLSLYTLACISTSLLFLAPLLVTLALKVNSLVGTERAPNSLSLVAGVGALLAMFANPFVGKLSDRTSSGWGMRRPWMVIGLLGGSLGCPHRGVGAQHPHSSRGLVHRPGVPRHIGAVDGGRRGLADRGRLSDRTGRRKVFVLGASLVYGLAMFVIALASSFNGFLVGMAISGLGIGVYVAVDLALAADVLPDRNSAAKDLGVFNIAGALSFSVAPAIAPVILAIGRRQLWRAVRIRRRLRRRRSARHPAGQGCPVSGGMVSVCGFAAAGRAPRPG